METWMVTWAGSAGCCFAWQEQRVSSISAAGMLYFFIDIAGGKSFIYSVAKVMVEVVMVVLPALFSPTYWK